MGFVAICTALYDYKPQGAGELEIKENELLYILEKSADDDWWKARKKADDEDEDEPEGLIPNNYVQEATPQHTARALYDYARQTDEEVSFSEDAELDVFDTSDDDWTLVGVNGEFGFAPANYIELGGAPAPKSPSVASNRQSAYDAAPPILAGHSAPPAASRAVPSAPAPQQEPTPDPSDEEENRPPLPGRPQSQALPSPVHIPSPTYARDEPPGVLPSPPYNRAGSFPNIDEQPYSPGGYHLYNINEMVSAMGRRKKMPTTLGLNIATGTIMISPEKSRDGPSQEWTADKLSHYSIEGKHVFLELVRPSKSLDLHAGAKDTAQEIVATLGEIAGRAKGEGLKEIIAAASGGSLQKKGKVMHDFMAQDDDEVTVAVDDEVVILDDTKSEDWWNVRRLKNGKEGVMPSSYIEVTGTVAVEPPSRSGANAGRSMVEQNRLEEERLAREAARAERARRDAEEARARSEIPQRGSSLAEEDSKRSRRDKRGSKSEGKSRSKPDTNKVRTWTDHSGSFKVEAQFIGVADGKIHLHKVNGVKIAVPVSKMSPADLAYVEKVTHESIEDNMPVADLIKMKRKSQGAGGQSGASIEPKQSDYDWFDFFLKAGVNPHTCERYAQAMTRDSMDESVLPEITQETLRTLGLKEGDTLKVMKYLNEKYGRNKAAPVNGEGGLFSGPGGALKDNSGRSRPDANRSTSDKVDAAAFSQEKDKAPSSDAKETPLAKAPAREARNGFDDDAWTPKPSQQPASPPRQTVASPPPRAPSAGMADLSLLDKVTLEPLEPTRREPQPQVAPAPAAPPQPQMQAPPPAAPQQPQQTGATPSFFAQVGQQANAGRQRPAPPQQQFTGSALLPPPQRPLSAPQNQQQGFGVQPLAPQLTGFATRQAPYGQSLDELQAQRLQQQQFQQMQLQPQQTGFPGQFGPMPNGMMQQPTGFQPQQFQQPYLNGNAAGSPFADSNQFQVQPQPTGYPTQMRPATGINSMLPPALQPQPTGFNQQPPQQPNGINQFQPQQQPFQQQQSHGMQPQMTGFPQQLQAQPTGFGQPPHLQPQPTGFGQPPQQNGFGQPPPTSFSPPTLPPMPQISTPAPLVAQKTGPAPDVKFGSQPRKLTPQPTGRRANLSSATPSNPFGF
ncbi:Actin cytoskeleton-regulatory complex protein sla1 [Cyphellophora attinorum]|uniref:Actin cytoskeleton-regulatory complex protein SLA1 n=1 Tax=Cyphellophora attinorum TaxID=1664694 RepID=A0A0N1P411_9EURO|nr:Actin cytoskeleton-regulatory complex protein sla1 [Phialophora attinorum]KPI44986.1 Actin cytoskeleton-regulatory complex protein sla1 [Phialophora attinorum]